MKTNNTPNRWLVVFGAILIQLALGALYAWSVFTKILTDPAGIYQFTATQTAWIFSAGLATFAGVMVLAGKWQAKTGPRLMTVMGGILLGLGFVLGGFFGTSFWAQFICIGLIAGAGIGLGYVVPIAVGVKWFPDKKGMITGLAVAGFGFGATIWVKLAGSWFGGLLNYAEVFGLPPVQSVFVIYGIVFTVLVLLGSIVMVNPPEGYSPKGWDPDEAAALRAFGGMGGMMMGDMASSMVVVADDGSLLITEMGMGMMGGWGSSQPSLINISANGDERWQVPFNDAWPMTPATDGDLVVVVVSAGGWGTWGGGQGVFGVLEDFSTHEGSCAGGRQPLGHAN